MRHARIIVLVLAIGGLLCSSSWARQQPTAKATSQSQPDVSKQPDSDLSEQRNSSPSPSYDTPIVSDQPTVREIGSARLLTGELSKLRWGSIFLRSAEFLQTFSPSDGSFGSLSSTDVYTSFFQATIAYDKQFRHSRLTLQYRPRVGISNGRTFTDFGNRDIEFQTDYSYRFDPRWSMSLAEALVYRGANNLYTDSYLSVDTRSLAAVQNSFLEGPFESLLSSTSLNFEHALSPRTHLSFGPRFSYGYSTGGYQADTPISSPTYAGVASLEHAVSPTRNIGVFYSFQRILVSRTFANTTYQTVGGSYSQQLAPSWRISLSLGASISDFVGRRQWSGSGNFSLVKNFQRAYLSLAYMRGHTAFGYINNGETQRADLGLGLSVTRRMSTQFGAGYEYTSSRLLSAVAPRAKVSGIYASGQVTYQLVPSVSWFASFVHRKQGSYDLQVFPGSRDFAATGVIWSPGRSSSY